MRTKRTRNGRRPSSNRRRSANRSNRPKPTYNNPDRIPKISIPPIITRRSFAVHSPTLTGGNKTAVVAQENWIDKIASLGGVMFKTIVSVIAAFSSNAESFYVPTGQVQLVLLGAEDLMYSSDLLEYSSVPQAAGHTDSIPYLPFRNARIQNATFKLECTGVESSRAGKIALLVQDLSAADVAHYRDSTNTKRWDKLVPVSFDTLVNTPGVCTSLVQVPITTTWRPKNGFPSSQLLGMGTDTIPSSLEDPPAGGDPVVAIYIGYQDLAPQSVKVPSPTEVYSPSESIFSLVCEAKVKMEEHGSTYVRWKPPVMYDALASVAVMDTHGKYCESVPFEQLRFHPSGFSRTSGLDSSSSSMENLDISDAT
jgi:hypothetical protein